MGSRQYGHEEEQYFYTLLLCIGRMVQPRRFCEFDHISDGEMRCVSRILVENHP